METLTATLKAAYDAALALAKKAPSPETYAAVKAAWAAYDASTPRRKGARFASRAGQRQAAARRAGF